MSVVPTYDDVLAAKERIKPLAVRTPLVRNDDLDAALGARAFVKAECLQRFGAFKIRGAANRIAGYSAAERANGVLAFSSGNHAIATAAAARFFGVPAFVVMPRDAPAIKRERAAQLGAEVVLYDRVTEDREAIGDRLCKERGLAIVRPFDDPYVIAGQGTVGLEIAEELDALDVVLVCASGGGLAAGVALAVHHRFPNAKVYAVEPEGHDDIARSLATGVRAVNAPGVRSICDALLVDTMGAIPFEIAKQRLAGSLVVDDQSVRAAMRFGFDALKLVIEPGGAIALAAALSGAIDLSGKTVAILASGGNVDRASFAAILQG